MTKDLADRLAALTLELLAVPSVTGDEAAIAGRVAALAGNRGCEVRRHGNSVVAHRAGPGPAIGLFGHLDTVSPAKDQPVGRQGDRLLGCGASDMKGGLAVMLDLAAAAPVAAGSQAADLWLVFYDREEGPYESNGLRTLLPLLPRLDLAIALEPTGNVVQAGCMGGIHAQVTFRGQRAHSARPWQGRNAIYGAAGVLRRLAELSPREVRIAGLPFYEVMSATMATTANSRNVVPDAFTVNVNVRFAPGRTAAEAAAELVDLVAGEAEVAIVDAAPAGDVRVDQPLLAGWIQRAGLAVEPKQAWTDVAQLTAAGIPAVNLGPGDPAQAHQAGEWVEIEALVTCHELLSDLLGPRSSEPRRDRSGQS